MDDLVVIIVAVALSVVSTFAGLIVSETVRIVTNKQKRADFVAKVREAGSLPTGIRSYISQH